MFILPLRWLKYAKLLESVDSSFYPSNIAHGFMLILEGEEPQRKNLMNVYVKISEKENRVIAKHKLLCSLHIHILTSVLLLVSCAYASSDNCLFLDGKPLTVKIGDPVEKILGTFSYPYSINDVRKAKSVRQVHILEKDKTVVLFSIDSKGNVFLIDIYEQCSTKESIGPGSTLDDALKAYGLGMIEPSDMGYYVTFSNLKGIAFLLNDEDIPKELRGIPDDVLTSVEEKKILGMRHIRIVAIQIFATE
jgi:hypothetical protein